MPVNLNAPEHLALHPVPGLRIGTAMAGIRKANRRDLVLFELAEGSAVAGVFTKNRFCAAPVQVCREHLAAAAASRLVVAPATPTPAPVPMAWCGRGAPVMPWPRAGHGVSAVLPLSTGVIMETLPVGHIEGRPAAARPTAESHWASGAGHLTTDTVPRRHVRSRSVAARSSPASQSAGMIGRTWRPCSASSPPTP
jgi:glutamate N-acetyltransferase/amino-acid N-acetyltransferase